MQVIRSLASEEKQSKLAERVRQICASGQYSEGKQTEEAEARLALAHGTPMVTMNSCGSALFTMFRWYAMRGHTSVVLQNNTFHATGAMAIEAGLIPVLCDSAIDDPGMSIESLRAICRSQKVTLVCLTHIGGWVAKDSREIATFCEEQGITLVEDCAHAWGVPGAGTFGEVACWSFYATKALPIGEGGALSTSHTLILEFAKLFRNYGKWNDEGVIRYTAGMNLRMGEFQAAVLCVQLSMWETILAARQRDAEKLQSIASCLLEGPTNWYKFPVRRLAVEGLQTVGAVYRRSDQLDVTLVSRTQIPGSLEHSFWWAATHVCLPIGEGIYDGMTEGHVRGALTQ